MTNDFGHSHAVNLEDKAYLNINVYIYAYITYVHMLQQTLLSMLHFKYRLSLLQSNMDVHITDEIDAYANPNTTWAMAALRFARRCKTRNCASLPSCPHCMFKAIAKKNNLLKQWPERTLVE